MTVLNDAQWRLVESAYCNSQESVTDIAKRHGISPGTVNLRRRKCGWPPRRANAIKHPSEEAPERPTDKAAIVLRFYRLINLKLEQLEADMARPGERTSADHERETRAIGTLVRNYERVNGLDQDNANDGKQGGDDSKRRAEAEAVRRDLAEKIVGLCTTDPGDGE